jgi:hypothetical protein
MAKTYKNDYFGINKIVSAILAFFFGGILGIIVRFLEGNVVAGIVRLIIAITGVGALIVGIIDFVMILLNGKILRVL